MPSGSSLDDSLVSIHDPLDGLYRDYENDYFNKTPLTWMSDQYAPPDDRPALYHSELHRTRLVMERDDVLSKREFWSVLDHDRLTALRAGQTAGMEDEHVTAEGLDLYLRSE